MDLAMSILPSTPDTDANHKSIIQDSIDRDVRPLLDLVDRLRKHGIEQDGAIPQIAVFGDQVSLLYFLLSSSLRLSTVFCPNLKHFHSYAI
jgi:hypothetical protein